MRIKHSEAVQMCEEHGIMRFELILEFGDCPTYSLDKIMNWIEGE